MSIDNLFNRPVGIECIQITERMGFCLGSAVECIWRASIKTDAIEDLQTAVWYLQREIARRTQGGEAESKCQPRVTAMDFNDFADWQLR